MSSGVSQFFEVFFEETAEHLADMERLLLNLSIDYPDGEELNAIFRAAHSIKGGAGTFGFRDMTVVTHVLESLLDRIRKNELAINREMVDLFLEAKDAIDMQLAGHRDGSEVDQGVIEGVCQRLEKIALASGAAVAPAVKGKKEEALAVDKQLSTYDITFAPAADTFCRGIRIESLFRELSGEGTLQATADLSAAPPFTEFDPESCYCRWTLQLTTSASEGTIRDIFEFVAGDEELHIRIATLDPGYGLFADAPGAPEAKSAADVMSSETLMGRRAYDKNETAPGAFGRRQVQGEQESSIRVSVPKVDRLVNQVGELVITQAMLSQMMGGFDPIQYAHIHNALTLLERNTRDLQDSVMSMRMVPISFVFSRFPRVVHDTAALLGKEVELKTYGETTELDRGLIEKIVDPLTHLIRNSLDHGIESPEVRAERGKEPVGTITLSAAQQEGKIVIEVADDGGGLNREKILAKAREKGLPVHDAMSDDEVWQLIFAPGFSTADVVTDVSGRGVGMDVVMKNVKSLGGRVQIRSTLGKGSSFVIRLPLTMAILDGLTVRVGSQVFIIPLNVIVESLQPRIEDISTVSGKGQVVNIRGDYFPLLPLHRLFHIAGAMDRPEEAILTLVEAEGEKFVLMIDELVGQQQVVIKSLEANYKKVDGTAGGTILGDGTVALILDMGSLLTLSRSGPTPAVTSSAPAVSHAEPILHAFS